MVLKKLDKFQLKAICHDYSYSLILASAGSGKTFTLLGRIEYLIKQKNLKPDEILVLSFTNETVNDFQRKVSENFGFQITVLTFHKLASKIIQNQNFKIITENWKNYLFDEFMRGYVFQNKSLKMYLFLTFHINSFRLKKYNEFLTSNLYKEFKKNVWQFMNLYQNREESIENILKNKSLKNRYFIRFAYIFLLFYQKEKDSCGLVDFDDMIIKAIEVLKNNHPVLKYKHILVDEFQDISYLRFQLLKEIVKTNEVGLTAVGDDYQTIYRFNGSDISIFQQLKEYYPSLNMFYLKNTYRNSFELITVANRFIIKNRNQIKKEIFSELHIEKPVEILYYHNHSMDKVFTYILSTVKDEILVLGRNSFDYQYYFSDKELIWQDNYFIYKKFPNQKFRFLTVHGSKGLETKNVIVLNLSNSTRGFPNQMELNPYFSKKDKQIFLEEERRLFYVALTRAKEKVFLIVPLKNPSLFIKEIKKESKIHIKELYFLSIFLMFYCAF